MYSGVPGTGNRIPYKIQTFNVVRVIPFMSATDPALPAPRLTNGPCGDLGARIGRCLSSLNTSVQGLVCALIHQIFNVADWQVRIKRCRCHSSFRTTAMSHAQHLHNRRYASLACNACRESKIKVPLYWFDINRETFNLLTIVVQWSSTKLFKLQQKEPGLCISCRRQEKVSVPSMVVHSS